MPEVGLKPTITESELAKTVHALDRSATVPGSVIIIKENGQEMVHLERDKKNTIT
jgi:hypothetical protein